MAREIKIKDIAGLMEDEIQEVVERTTLLLTGEVIEQTPVRVVLPSDPPSYKGGNDLRNDWQTDIGKFRATVTNSMQYAEPVLYGNNLPPSWQGRYRTRQGTVPGFPDLIAKEIAVKEVPRIIEAIRRRN
nr:phage protein [uncultured Mediterranean phage uvMED]